MELWSNLIKGSNTVIWCDGLVVKQSKDTTASGRKRPSLDSDGDAEESALLRKDERDSTVKKYIDELSAAHKEIYTPMQYRIWAEMKLRKVTIICRYIFSAILA